MSNHVHLVLEVDPQAPAGWTDLEVAQRWLTIFGGGATNDVPLAARTAALARDFERINIIRQRLGSLSWFMRALNEPIARRANHEDGCTGRFWEGRFKCQTLLDDTALLACMVYVDLNPARAGVAESAMRSAHTSARRRVKSTNRDRKLVPLASSIVAHTLEINEIQYLQLLDWTGRSLHRGNRGAIPNSLVDILARISLDSRQWLVQVPATESHYWRAVGTAQNLLEHTQQLSCR
ncbi:MAG: transposase, partial [Lysobacterales bacterium]